MCGIYGFVGENFNTFEAIKMSESLKHRGPDDEGVVVVDSKSNEINHYRLADTDSHYSYLKQLNRRFLNKHEILLGHRRLSIIDLSPKGHQPMEYDGFVIVYNGEIYNYLEIRKELEKNGWKFSTSTDTEVVLKAYIEYGKDSVKLFNGMWAFVIWDPRERCLFISRDRYGIKPLYYYYDGKNFAFSSEIKALLDLSLVKRIPNFEEIKRYIVWGSQEHLPETMFEKIYRFLPSHNAYFCPFNASLRIERYYEIITNPELETFSEEKLKIYSERLKELFLDSVKLRLRSDVKIGTSFSGGVDSTGIVYAVNKFLKSQIGIKSIGEKQYTFSSIFKTPEYKYADESKWIEIAEKDLLIKAIKIEPTLDKILADIEKVVYYQDEPFNSMSVFAQWYVMELPRKYEVIVTLDGQGADELFGGYLKYVPIMINQLIGNMRVLSAMNELIKFKTIRDTSFKDFLKIFLMSLNPRFSIYIASKILSRRIFEKHIVHYKGNKFMEWRNVNLHLKLDIEEGLVRLLRYADRNSMAHSIESRFPWLDYRLVDFAFSVPSNYKIHNGWTKYIERVFLSELANRKLVWRRNKYGFPTPEEHWLKTLRNKFNVESSRIIRHLGLKRESLENLTYNPSAVSLGIGWKLINLYIWEKVFKL